MIPLTATPSPSVRPSAAQSTRIVVVGPMHRPSVDRPRTVTSLLSKSNATAATSVRMSAVPAGRTLIIPPSATRSLIIKRPAVPAVVAPQSIGQSVLSNSMSAPIIVVTNKKNTTELQTRFNRPITLIGAKHNSVPTFNVLKLVQNSSILRTSATSLLPLKSTSRLMNTAPQETVVTVPAAEAGFRAAKPMRHTELRSISPINIVPVDENPLEAGGSVLHGDHMQVRIAGEVVRQIHEADCERKQDVVVLAEWDKEDGSETNSETETAGSSCADRALIDRPEDIVSRGAVTASTSTTLDADATTCTDEPHRASGTVVNEQATTEADNHPELSLKTCSVVLDRLDSNIKIPVKASQFKKSRRRYSGPLWTRRKQGQPKCLKMVSDVKIKEEVEREAPAAAVVSPLRSLLTPTVMAQVKTKRATDVHPPPDRSPHSPPDRSPSPTIKSVLMSLDQSTVELASSAIPPVKPRTAPVTSPKAAAKPTSQICTDGNEKARFLMVKTKAGTFLVPMAAVASKSSVVKLATPVNITGPKTNASGVMHYKSILPAKLQPLPSARVRIKEEPQRTGYGDDEAPPTKCPKLETDRSAPIQTLSGSDKIKALKAKLKRQQAQVDELRRRRSNVEDPCSSVVL